MPYKKRYKKKRKGKAKQALKLARFAVSLASKTKKRNDNNVGRTLVPADTVSYTLLNGLTHGDAENNREGNTAQFASFHIKLEMFKNAAVDHNFIRIMLIQDKMTDGLNPASGTLLQSGNNLLSSINRDYLSRFKILWTKYVALNSGASTARIITIYKKVSILSRYNGATNALSSMSENPVFITFQSDNQTNQPTVALYSRNCFYDQ